MNFIIGISSSDVCITAQWSDGLYDPLDCLIIVSYMNVQFLFLVDITEPVFGEREPKVGALRQGTFEEGITWQSQFSCAKSDRFNGHVGRCQNISFFLGDFYLKQCTQSSIFLSQRHDLFLEPYSVLYVSNFCFYGIKLCLGSLIFGISFVKSLLWD